MSMGQPLTRDLRSRRMMEGEGIGMHGWGEEGRGGAVCCGPAIKVFEYNFLKVEACKKSMC